MHSNKPLISLSIHALIVGGAFLMASELTMTAAAASNEERLSIGSFVAAKTQSPPTIDGTISDGEWDGALVTSGFMTPFGHDLLQAKTTVGFTFDEERFYFLFDCVRGDNEWKLWKSVRENDGYSFGDPSIEIWITPPTLVPETYQNVINTYPAVLDNKMIPTRGYTAQGWRGNWELGVEESDTRYVIEASLPITDIDGFDSIVLGSVWRFLLCRTSPGTKPRPQGSWSITQGFAELAQHPAVKLLADTPVLQVRNVTSLLSGTYDIEITGVGSRKAPANIDIELRWHDAAGKAETDTIQHKVIKVGAGKRHTINVTGRLPEKKSGNLTITAKTRDAVIFQQTWPYTVNGWTPSKPRKPERARREAKELDLMVQYGPVNNVTILRADILDLPGREKVTGGTIQIVAPETGKTLLEKPLPPFRNWYSNAHFTLQNIGVPRVDYNKVAYVENQNDNIREQNEARKKKGQKPLPLKDLPIPEPMKVQVKVSVTDDAGEVLESAAEELELRRYRFQWENNDIGVSDKVIAPWTPVQYENGSVGVWNRGLEFDGLGLLKKLENDGLQQIKSMRLVAVQNGKKTVIDAGAPELQRLVDAEAVFTGFGTGAGLSLTAETNVEFDGFVLSRLTIGPTDSDSPAEIDKLYWEVVLPESEATHFCSTAGGWSAVHAKTPAYGAAKSPRPVW